MENPTISAERLRELWNSGTDIPLIDVRTPVEFRESHVEFARNIPLDQLDPHAVMESRQGSADEPLYVVCRSGNRGKTALDRLRQAGYRNIVNIEGGTLACEAAGLPLVRGQKAMSLERQVRIAAGSLVLLGLLLSWLSHPAFVAVTAFVGVGLIFAGVTDTCGMGLLLARMPWNQVQEKTPTVSGDGKGETIEANATPSCCG